jgi:hypothetical protein
MTVSDEVGKHANYFKLSFVEMLELVGRAAEIWAE